MININNTSCYLNGKGINLCTNCMLLCYRLKVLFKLKLMLYINIII